MGCPQGSGAMGGRRAEGAAGLQGGGGCPCQGGGCLRGTEAPRKAPHGPSLFAPPPPGRYLRLRPRGFLRPLPGGPALPAAAAPLLQRQPAPAAPGRLPLAPPGRPRQLSFLSSSISIPLPGPVEREQRPLRRLGDPRDAAPRSPPAAAKEESGCGQGLPGRAGTGSVPPRRRALPAARTRKVASVPSARDPPSTSPIFLA